MRYCSTALVFVLCVACSAFAQNKVQNRRETSVRNDKKTFDTDDTWIYGDLERATLAARRQGKPLMVVFRCVP